MIFCTRFKALQRGRLMVAGSRLGIIFRVRNFFKLFNTDDSMLIEAELFFS